MALGGTSAIARCQRGFYCGIVLMKPLSKTLQLTAWTGEHPRHPGIEPLGGPLPYHLCKGLRVPGQHREERIGLLDLEELDLLSRRALVRTAEQAIGQLTGRQRRRRWGRRSGPRGLRPTFVPDLTLPPGGQHPGHAPVSPMEALGAHLVPELRRALLPGLPALPEIGSIRCETTAIAGAPFALGEPLPRAPMAQGALRGSVLKVEMD